MYFLGASVCGSSQFNTGMADNGVHAEDTDATGTTVMVIKSF